MLGGAVAAHKPPKCSSASAKGSGKVMWSCAVQPTLAIHDEVLCRNPSICAIRHSLSGRLTRPTHP